MNRARCRLWVGVWFVAMIAMSCAAGISEQSQSQVTYMGTFAELQQAPEKYTGETVMWGGKIVSTQPNDGNTEMVVLQLALGSQDRPQDNDQSQGRFLALSAQFLDPALFSPGTLITVVGRMQGAQKRLIGQMAYHYPVIDIIEVKKWTANTDASPRFHFGIGVGKSF